MIKENGAMLLNATLVDRRDKTCDLVAPVVPTEVPVAVETRDEEMRDSANLSEDEAPQIPVLEGARGVSRSKQPSEADRCRHELSHLPHVPWCTICCSARTIDELHDGSVNSHPKIVGDYAEINMNRHTTPMRVFFMNMKKVAVLVSLQN